MEHKSNTMAEELVKPLDPLHRVFVYNDDRFQTKDKRYYARDEQGVLHRQIPKVRGKAARRADKLERRGQR